MKKAGLFVAGLAMLCTLSAEAQSGGGRKRPARPNPTAPTRTCMTIASFPTGKKVHYQQEGTNYKLWLHYISDSGSQMRVNSHLEATEQGYPVVADTATTTFYAVNSGIMEVSRISGDTTSVMSGVPFIGTVTTQLHIEVNFTPALVVVPITQYCSDTTWQIPAFTGSVTTSGGVSQSRSFTGGPATGKVLAVNQSITVPAGTFNTVKVENYEVNQSNGTVRRVERWFNTDGIEVKQIYYESNGSTNTWVVTKIE